MLSFIWLSSFSSKAQIGSAASQVNLVVNELMSLEIEQSSVMINMNLPSHYKFGNNSGIQQNHVKVTATSNYTLAVSATNQNFTLNGLNTNLPVNIIKIEANTGNLNPNFNSGQVSINSGVYLNASQTNLLNSHSSETLQSFDVNYVIPTSATPNFLNIPSGNYKTTVIYTIIPQ
ncbi:hypothetical protein [Mesonia maritima]